VPTAAPAEKPCPTCGKRLQYVEAYERWYCYSCKIYAPKDEEKPPVEPDGEKSE